MKLAAFSNIMTTCLKSLETKKAHTHMQNTRKRSENSAHSLSLRQTQKKSVRTDMDILDKAEQPVDRLTDSHTDKARHSTKKDVHPTKKRFLRKTSRISRKSGHSLVKVVAQRRQ